MPKKNKISKYFSREEVACKCGCGFDSMDVETLRVADEVREYVNTPIVCSSGCRCVAHNLLEGGADYSFHTQARAMDLIVPEPKIVYDWLCKKYPDKYGFGLYPTFIHVDTRSGKAARWRKT